MNPDLARDAAREIERLQKRVSQLEAALDVLGVRKGGPAPGSIEALVLKSHNQTLATQAAGAQALNEGRVAAARQERIRKAVDAKRRKA